MLLERKKSSLRLLGCEGSENLVLLFEGLEATVAHFGGCIDELDVDGSELLLVGRREDGFSHCDDLLFGANDATLDHEEVLVDLTVVREASERGDVLLDEISLGGGIVLDATDGTSTNAVDLLVEFSTMMITELTRSSNSPLNGHWMPGTNTGDLSQTSMGLSGKSRDTESLDDTSSTLTAGNSDGINALVVVEDLTNRDILLKVLLSPLDLIGDLATVDLDFHKVSLLLSKVDLTDLGVRENADNSAVFLDALDVTADGFGGFGILLPFLGVLGESLLLGVHPVLIETTFEVVSKMGSPDGAECAESTRGLDVADHTSNLHRRALDDGHSLNDVLLEDLLTLAAFVVSHNVSHTGLVAHESGEVDGLFDIVPWEMSNSALMSSSPATWQEAKGTTSGFFKFPVRHP